MWTITPDDIRRAKEELTRRRSAAEAQHAEELKAIDAELAEIATIEQAAGAFARKYKSSPPPNGPEQPEFVKGLTTPVRLSVGNRNWGDARFTPAASASG